MYPTSQPKTYLLAALASLALTACGGGGGGGDDTPAPTITNEVVSVDAAENSTHRVALEGQTKTMDVTRSFPAIAFAVDEETNELTITVGEVEQVQGDARVEITTTANIRYIVDVVAENTSAAPIMAEAETLSEISSGAALAADDLRLANVALELEYLASQISFEEKEAARVANTAAVDSAATALMTSIETLEQSLADFRNGDISETQLSQSLDVAKAHMSTLDEASATAVEAVLSTVNALIDVSLPADLEGTYPITYVAEADRYSRYMTTDLGTLSPDGSFSFSADYDFLNSVFAFASSASAQ